MNAIDTNVLLYVYDEAAPRHQQIARDLVARIDNGVTLWQVACEFISVSRKKSSVGMPIDVAWRRLEETLTFMPLVVPTRDVLSRAKQLQLSHQLQWWDSLLYAACIEAGVEMLYSQDLPGEGIEGLEIINPFA
jgi:predicted nucleic acid-binding protein